MAPSWARRTLLFAESPLPSEPMWNRPGNRSPIFMDPSPPASPVWARPSTTTPIFEDAVISPESMWARPTTGVPSCPCCIGANSFVAPRSPPPTPPSRGYNASPSPSFSAARPATASPAGAANKQRLRKMQSTVSLRKMPSTIGLRLKRSFAQLRGRSSEES